MQHNIMNALHARGLPTPRSLWLELDPAPLGGPFLIMEKLNGTVISDRPSGVHGAGLLFESTIAEREQCWSSCIEFLAQLHRIDASHADFAFLGKLENARDALQKKLNTLEEFLRWAEEVLPRIEDLHYALQWLRDHCPMPNRYSICRDDPKLGNILFANGRLAAALDWETVNLALAARLDKLTGAFGGRHNAADNAILAEVSRHGLLQLLD